MEQEYSPCFRTTSLSGFSSLSQAVSEGSSTLKSDPYMRTSATTLVAAGTHWMATLGFEEPSLSSPPAALRCRRGVEGG